MTQVYLLPNSTVSQSYLHEGLCNEASQLYNELHCEVCTVRVQEVTMWGCVRRSSNIARAAC